MVFVCLSGCEDLPVKLAHLSACTVRTELIDAKGKFTEDLKNGKGNFTFGQYCR